MGVTEQLARFAIETKAGFLTPELIESAKAKFLDTLGIMVAGSQHATGRIALETAREIGGHPEATIVGYADKTSISLAGFVNGVSAHALEYDDNTLGVGHVSVCLVPGCLAVAERLNLSGRQLIEAFAIGFEVTSRVAKGLRPYLIDRGWHPIGIVGAQGVAVATCRMLGLDQLATRMAMGIVASSATGVRKNVGSMGKAFHVGNGVRAGILAAALARHGFKVDPDIIEGADDSGEGHQRFGLADTFNGIGNHRLQLILEHLGESFELGRNTTIVRMHPGSTAPGAAIDGMIDLATRHNLTIRDVDEIHVECTPQCVAIAPYPEPSDEHHAKFCLPYTLAVAFIDREIGIAQYSDARITNRKVKDFMRRIRISVPDDLKHHRGQWGENGVNWGEARLTINLKDGKVVSRACSHAKGWPEQPASWEDLCAKFEECSAVILSKSQIDDAVAMLKKLQDVDSVRELTRILVPVVRT